DRVVLDRGVGAGALVAGDPGGHGVLLGAGPGTGERPAALDAVRVRGGAAGLLGVDRRVAAARGEGHGPGERDPGVTGEPAVLEELHSPGVLSLDVRTCRRATRSGGMEIARPCGSLSGLFRQPPLTSSNVTLGRRGDQLSQAG